MGGRLRPSDLSSPGITRRRRGRGFSYADTEGRAVHDPGILARIKALAIPPAWEDVWICPSPEGHIQALGRDSAGRRQYRYHDAWQARRAADKHDAVLHFARRLPDIRHTVDEDLAGPGLTRRRVLGTAVRLIDLGLLRPGNEEYTDAHDTYGVTTLLRGHVRCRHGDILLDFPAKGGHQWRQTLHDAATARVIAALRRGRADGERLLAYRNDGSRHTIGADDLNAYIRELSGEDFSAKDFRTWHATVLAAVGLAVSSWQRPGTRGRHAAVVRMVREVADYLGNTPAVARSSYIDPRVIELYENGVTIAAHLDRLGASVADGEPATHGAAEEATWRLLSEHVPENLWPEPAEDGVLA
jgi:DNA topoisomerase IB